MQYALNANIPDKALTCFAQEMEVSVMGKGSVCSNEQAVEILRQFMESNPVVSCQILHKGKKMNAGFYIMNIVVSSQKRYRIYALERNENNENLIGKNIHYNVEKAPRYISEKWSNTIFIYLLKHTK